MAGPQSGPRPVPAPRRDRIAPRREPCLADPLVSVVVATFNRSNVLRLALESLRGSTFTAWEARVVGDGCTDDTEEVVASLGDPRIHFENLPENFGEQSRPNNVGCQRARGRYIAFLNHDDLYFPDHLETGVSALERTGADLVFAATLQARRSTPEELEAGLWELRVGAPPGSRYEPYLNTPASGWLLRRELHEELGGWRPAVACWGPPSQDFLFRARKAGRDLRFVPRATVLRVPSNKRPDVYARREAYENEFFYEQMVRDPRFREKLLERAAIRLAGLDARRSVRRDDRSRSYRLLYPAFLRLGWSPNAIRHWRRYGWRKRALIEQLRRRRGLDGGA